jgi:hypothetical protein
VVTDTASAATVVRSASTVQEARMPSRHLSLISWCWLAVAACLSTCNIQFTGLPSCVLYHITATHRPNTAVSGLHHPQKLTLAPTGWIHCKSANSSSIPGSLS